MGERRARVGLTPHPEDLEPITGPEESIVAKLKARLGESYRGEQRFRGQLSVWVDPGVVADTLRFLKTDPELLFQFLTDFEVVYIVFSPTFSRRLFLKTRVDEETAVPTATTVWRGANFMEREVFDMFGVRFAGHPNLERILTPDGWLGHPLRKDFPTQSAQFPNVEN